MNLLRTTADVIFGRKRDGASLGYCWKVAVNIAVLLIVVWAMGKLQGRTEILIISVLGLLYAIIRSRFDFLVLTRAEMTLHQQQQMDEIRLLLDRSYAAPNRNVAYKRIRVNFYIDSGRFGSIGVICALSFFTQL
jgi:hypothetical protein